MKRVVAVVGLSGVGKTTLVSAMAKRIPLLHLQASALIKAEQIRRNKPIESPDQLRCGSILDNQRLLIDGFGRATKMANGLIVFDGHTVIFNQDTMTEISSSVFRSLECERIIVVQANPMVIRDRRSMDRQRSRPHLDVEMLTVQQNYVLEVAVRIAADLGVQLHCLVDGSLESFAKAIGS